MLAKHFQPGSTGGGAAAFDPTTTFSLFEDFDMGFYWGANSQIAGNYLWASVLTGSPIITVNTGAVIPSTAANLGVVEFGTQAGAAYGAGITSGQAASNTFPSFVVGGGQITFEALVNIPTISDGVDNLQVDIGFRDGPGWNGAANQWNIMYQKETSNNWQLLTTASSVNTTLRTGPVVTTGWHHVKLVMNAAGTSVEGFVDGTSIGTNSTNIPTVKLPPIVDIRKTLGTNPRYLGLDYIKIDKTFTTPR